MARPLIILALSIGVPASIVAAVPAADVATPVKAAVNRFFDRIARGKAKDNEELFLNRDVPITGFAVQRPNVRPFFQKTAAEFLKQFGTEPGYFAVDRIDVIRIHDHLAVATVEWKTGGARGASVITWSKNGEHWRIVGFFDDRHFVW